MDRESITTFFFLKLDPPDSHILFMKAASLSFLNDEVWTASCVKQGRYLRIFYFQRGLHNIQRFVCLEVSFSITKQ